MISKNSIVFIIAMIALLPAVAGSLLFFGYNTTAPGWSADEIAARCDPQMAIKPISSGVATAKNVDGQYYWSISIEHVGYESLPLYWWISTIPVLEGGGSKVVKIVFGQPVSLHSQRSPINYLDINYKRSYSYSPNLKDPAGMSPILGLFPVGGKSTVIQSVHGTDSRAKPHPRHVHDDDRYAVDIEAPVGAPIYSVGSGTVALVENRYPDTACPDIKAAGYGNKLVLVNDQGYEVTYAHTRQGSIHVQEGDRVLTGQRIAEVGASGATFTPALHFEISTITPRGYQTLPVAFHLPDGTDVSLEPGTNIVMPRPNGADN